MNFFAPRRHLSSWTAGAIVLALAPASAQEHARVSDYPGVSLADGVVVRLELPPNARSAFSIRVPMSDPELKELTLALAPISLRSDVYELVEHRADGSYVAVDPGDERTYSGNVRGVDSSRVAASLLEDGLVAAIFLPDGTRHFVEPLSRYVAGALSGDHVVYRDVDTLCEGDCGTTERHRRTPEAGESSSLGSCGGGMCLAQLACDADFEYYTAHGSSSTIVQHAIASIVNVLNHQYATEIDNLSHLLTTILVRTAEPDPYTATDSGTLLDQLRSQWNANHGAITRDTVHMFTGKNMDGSVIGIAFIGVICNLSSAYGVSQSDFTGSFACKTDLTAHELGHNWNAGHCSCGGSTMNPGITCANTFIGAGSNSVSQIDSFRDSRTCLSNGGVPPANNYCDTATLINGSPTSVSANNTAASTDGASTCASFGGGGEDLFWVFSVPASGTVTVNTCGSSIDTVLSVHAGCPATTANEVACNDNHAGCGCANATDSCISFSGIGGTTYYVRVAGAGSSPVNGPFQLNVTLPPVPNDVCGSAIALTDGGMLVGGLSNAASEGTATCGTSNGNRDVWYQYTATCAGTVTVDTCGTHDAGGNDTGMDTTLSVYNGCPGTTGNQIACSGDWTGGACSGVDNGLARDSSVTFAVTNGQNVKIRVSHFGSRTTANYGAGLFQIRLDFQVTPLTPAINAIGDTSLPCESGNYIGPTPSVTNPSCMGPVGWSLDAGPAGMTIDAGTGVVDWLAPFGGVHVVTIRATNSTGFDTESWSIDVAEICPMCPGDGNEGSCPCGNVGGPGRGCENSGSTGGALLTATGDGLLSADTVVFTSSGERPTALTIFLQGDTLIGPINFGDGLRCAGGSLKRLFTQNAVGGTATAPTGGDPTVSARSAALGDPISAGQSRWYHAYYRDADPVFCPAPTGNTFNSSSGLAIRWN